MFTQADCIEYSQSFINKIKAKGINLKYAKLFGSFSKHTQNNDSDIDILLVADEFSGIGFLDNALIYQELYEFPMINIKTYTSEDYQKGDPLIVEINRTGIEL
jgi:predicted nucleotidyltransferase